MTAALRRLGAARYRAPVVEEPAVPFGYPGTYRIEVARSIAVVEAVLVHEIHEAIRGTRSMATAGRG